LVAACRELAELENDDLALGQRPDRHGDIHRIAAEPVEQAHDQHLAIADLTEHRLELRSLRGRDCASDAFVCIPVIDLVAGAFNLKPLVLDSLPGGAEFKDPACDAMAVVQDMK
jgi:hypothetical protein